MNGTAYVGYNVNGGEWEVSEYGIVLINDTGTSLPALDADIRTTWSHGGSVN